MSGLTLSQIVGVHLLHQYTSDILSDGQLASQPAAICQPTSHLTKCQPDPQSYLWGTSDQPKVWPNVSLTGSLILGVYIWPNANLIRSLTKCQADPKPHPGGGYIWPNVNLVGSLTKCQPDLKPHLGEYVWPNVKLTQSLTKYQPDPKPHPWGTSVFWTNYEVLLLLHRGLFLRKTNDLALLS